MAYVPADNTRSYPSIRDYKINMLSDKATQIGLAGDFILLKDVVYLDNGGSRELRANMPVTFLINSSNRVTLYPGQTLRTPYNTLEVENRFNSNNYAKFECNIAAGFGDMRDYKAPVSRDMLTLNEPIPGNDSILLSNIVPDWLRFDSIREIRLNVPADQDNGISFTDGEFPGLPVWLERGQVEWLDFAGDIEFINDGANTVNINIALILW